MGALHNHQQVREPNVKLLIQIALTGLFALGIVACDMLEDKITDVAGPEIAAFAVDTSCTGAPEFAETALEGLSPAIAGLVAEGIKRSCDLRPTRTTISATVYDRPIDQFCAEIPDLAPDGAGEETRNAFNARKLEICGDTS